MAVMLAWQAFRWLLRRAAMKASLALPMEFKDPPKIGVVRHRVCLASSEQGWSGAESVQKVEGSHQNPNQCVASKRRPQCLLEWACCRSPSQGFQTGREDTGDKALIVFMQSCLHRSLTVSSASQLHPSTTRRHLALHHTP